MIVMKNYVIKIVRFLCMTYDVKAKEIYVLREGSRYLKEEDQRVIGKGVYL